MQLTLTIERLSKSGDGVAQHGGRTVFVDGALPGEQVLAEVVEDGKVLRGALRSVIRSSPSRRAPACPLAATCGGCDWLHLDELAQRLAREEIVQSTLEHLGGIGRDSYQRLPTVFDTRAMGYRRRAVMHPVGGRLGFNARGSHARVAVDHCPALTDPLAGLPAQLSEGLGAAALKDLEEAHLLEALGQRAVSLHLKGAVKPKLLQRAQALVRAGAVAGVVLVPKTGPSQAVGDPELDDGGVGVRPDAFAQANAQINGRLVRAALEQLGLDGTQSVLELFCGNGNFTFSLAGAARGVVAVESSPVSIALAQKAARRRQVTNVRFVQGDAAKVAQGLGKEQARFDRLLVDPPRAGAVGVAQWASSLQVDRVVYVACDPASLARDARALHAAGYLPVTLQLFELFPQTPHVEAVMQFAKASGVGLR